jgi:hypothetical protein
VGLAPPTGFISLDGGITVSALLEEQAPREVSDT